jgi:hypothetical protein
MKGGRQTAPRSHYHERESLERRAVRRALRPPDPTAERYLGLRTRGEKTRSATSDVRAVLDRYPEDVLTLF